jgi:hypothetical protein
MRIVIPFIAIGTLACGCGTESTSTMTPDEPTPAGYTRLIGRSWSVEPGVYTAYKCVRFTAQQDMYITGFEAQAPAGTHHTILTLASEDNQTAGPDGEYDCGASSMGLVMLYASSVGTSPLDLPEGVGLEVKAGQQLHFQIHLSNVGDEPLSGETSVLVKSQDTPPDQIAEMVLAGTFNFTIPTSATPYDVTGGCTADRDYSVFAAWPHMHELAQHQRFEVISGDNSTVMVDQPFVFGEQNYYMQSPVVGVHVGDEVRVTCTYFNASGQPVSFGDSQNAEMCFTGMYRYPVLGQGVFHCTDNP